MLVCYWGESWTVGFGLRSTNKKKKTIFVPHSLVHYVGLPFIVSNTEVLVDRKFTGARTSCDMLCCIMIRGTPSGVCLWSVILSFCATVMLNVLLFFVVLSSTLRCGAVSENNTYYCICRWRRLWQCFRLTKPSRLHPRSKRNKYASAIFKPGSFLTQTHSIVFMLTWEWLCEEDIPIQRNSIAVWYSDFWFWKAI